MCPVLCCFGYTPGAWSSIPLAQVAGQAFHLSVGEVHEIKNPWWGVGECVLWIVFYFWAVWIFDALLPPKPEQTPFESYLRNQIREQTDSGTWAERGQQFGEGTPRSATP